MTRKKSTQEVSHHPVSIPAGSYEFKEVLALQEKAAKAAEAKRAEILNEGFDKIRSTSEDAVPDTAEVEEDSAPVTEDGNAETATAAAKE